MNIFFVNIVFSVEDINLASVNTKRIVIKI